MNKKTLSFGIIFVLLVSCAPAETVQVKKVDFLAPMGLSVNGAGPLLVRADRVRNRVVLVHTNTSSLSIISGRENKHLVTNIAFKNRIPQYLKSEALYIDETSGLVYVIGNKSLHVVFPEEKRSLSVDTGEQYEMVGVNEKTGDAFLVGRGSPFLAFFNLKTGRLGKIKWVDRTETLGNLNQTPPPPIRKVVCDASLERVIAVDGFTSTLHLFSARTGRLLAKRKLPSAGGARWHFAGYNPKTHHLFLVVETEKREVIEALKIDVVGKTDQAVSLPGLTEGVGVNYNPTTDQVYVPYDNHPSIHLVDFKNGGEVDEIKIPSYGNDASALDEKNNLLYVSSWAYGEIEAIDLASKRLKKRILDVGIIPHMFNMAFNPGDGLLYIPLGATAVNGSFGAAVTVLDPVSEKKYKINTGWAPVDLISRTGHDSFLVFNSQDEFAEVFPDGNFQTHKLPYDYPHETVHSAEGNIYLSYGPHQSYWPVVYIWGAKNGILNIDAQTLAFYDRRIPRLAHRLVMAKNGTLYGLQNNWGLEKQFLFSFPDEVRSPNQGDMRLELDDLVDCETTQRILAYDGAKDWLYVARVAENEGERGIFQVIDLKTRKTIFRCLVGRNPTDLVFDDARVYIGNFDSDSLSVFDKEEFTIEKIKTGRHPLKLAVGENSIYCLNHGDNSLQEITRGGESRVMSLPVPGKPGNIVRAGDNLVVTSHTSDAFYILAYSLRGGSFTVIHKEEYPYGETTFDTDNSAFYLRGQFGDSLFEINRIKMDSRGRTWITDYLSGKLFILSGLSN